VAASGNVTITAAGSVGVTVTSTGTTIAGNLTVDGTTTTINSTTLTVDDKNIELASIASPTDTTADGAGITIKGATDKTFNWVNANTAFTSSENLNLASGKTYKINATDVLTSSIVLGSATGITVGGTSTTTIGLGTNTSAANTVTVGGAITGNVLKIAGTASGTTTLSSDVTTGVINLWTGVTTGTVNFGTGMTTGTVNVGTAAAGTVAVKFNTSASSASAAALTVAGGVGAASAYFTSLTVTNTITGSVSGSASSATTATTATTATNATNIATTGSIVAAGTYYPIFVDSNGSSNQASKTAAAFTFNPGTGTLTATIVTASSDARLKENVKPITGALALVQQLEGVLFNRIGQAHEEIGVIAQQVEAVVPQLVFTDENGMKSVAYANTVALLIEAIKEQQVQIDELKAKIN
jgi:hypothetical protein